MIRGGVAVLALLASQPAWACHRYSVWRYPWPQRCEIGTRAVGAPVRPRLVPTPIEKQPVWYVEITKLPTLEDMQQVEDPRGYAINQLKKLMH